MIKSSVENFQAFLSQYVSILNTTTETFGSRIIFEYKQETKTIFFHKIIPNSTSDLNELNSDWIVWEDLWIRKTEIIKSSLKAIFGDIKGIHGRQTKVERIDKTQCQTFLEENHLFGSVLGKFRMGLFFKSELVGIMTFSAGRNWQDTGGKAYELIRFCNHRNYRVHGGFTKLLKGFCKLRNPVQIMTYTDVSWYHSKMYQNSGFILDENIKLHTFWINTNTFERTLEEPNSNDSKNALKVVNYRSYKFTWEKEENHIQLP